MKSEVATIQLKYVARHWIYYFCPLCFIVVVYAIILIVLFFVSFSALRCDTWETVSCWPP